MRIAIHPHAAERAAERGASEDQIVATLTSGVRFPAKYGRTGFRQNFDFDGIWRGRRYTTKQIEAFAVPENDGWLVITVLVKFF